MARGEATTFGRRLRAWRIDNDMTQTELAQSLHVRQGTISDWEVGFRHPRGAMLRKMLRLICAPADIKARIYEEVAQR